MYNAMKLAYEYDALEPYIDARTVGIHYNNHYLTYLNRLNQLLAEQGFNESVTLPELLKKINQFDAGVQDEIIFNIGGVLNHELYFQSISANKKNYPTGKLNQAINEQFGSFDNLKQKMIHEALILPGSGYTFLVLTPDKKLQIINTNNQETPYLYGFIPIIAIDVWEHAYYLNYQSNRKQYIINFFEIIDFDNISQLYEKNI